MGQSDTKQVGYAIMLTMKKFCDIEKALWTLQMISHATRNPMNRTKIALNWLINHGYILEECKYYDGEKYTTYHLTTEGDTAISEAKDNPALDGGYSRWVDRTLKGMNSLGRETSLKNAAIPSQQFMREPTETIEEQLDRKREGEFHARRICEKLNITPEELMEKIESGKIGLCQDEDGISIGYTGKEEQ